MSWKSEQGHLVCQWSELAERAPYHPALDAGSRQVKPTAAVPEFLDFTRLSPFGGGIWHDLERRYKRHAA